MFPPIMSRVWRGVYWLFTWVVEADAGFRSLVCGSFFVMMLCDCMGFKLDFVAVQCVALSVGCVYVTFAVYVHCEETSLTDMRKLCNVQA